MLVSNNLLIGTVVVVYDMPIANSHCLLQVFPI